MKFSQRSEYGVRVLVDLARHYGEGPVSLNEVARDEGLSRTFLEQIVIPLRRAGLVQSRHGVRGGYELARAPREITMGDVLRVLEGSLAPMFCVGDAPDRDVCALEDQCGTRVLWIRVRDGINAALDTTLLSDLLVDGAGETRGAGTDRHTNSAPASALASPATLGPADCESYRP